MKKNIIVAALLLVVLVALGAGCGAAPAQVVEKEVVRTVVVEKPIEVEKEVVRTVVVEKAVEVEKEVVRTVVVEKAVEVEKVVTKVVEKEVEVVVTATPVPRAPGEARDITITFFEEPDNLNPMYSGMWFSGVAMDLYLRGLWVYDENNQFVPELAAEVPSVENGGISADGKTITIKLRKGVTWHDGTPVTSKDLVFTWEAIMDEGNAPQSRYPYEDFVESVEAVDDYTAVVHFSEPYAGWWSDVFNRVLPEHILGPVMESEGTLDNAEWNRAPVVGNGPFKFAEWVSGDHITLEAYDNYWRGKPRLDRVFIKIVPDAEAQMAAIETGDTDIGVFLSYADVPTIEALPDVEIQTVAYGYNEGWFFNLDPETGHPALQDKRVRRAIAMAVDRWKITDELLLGLTQPPKTFWDGTAYASSKIQYIPYDPEGAKALLDEAGWVDTDGDGIRDKDGVKLELTHSTTAGRQVREDTQLVAQQMLADVGIGMVISNNSYDTMWNSFADDGPIATGQYDIAEWSDASYPDPGTSAYYWLCSEIPSDENPEGGNWYGVCMDELDKLLQDQATVVDVTQRRAMFDRIQEIMHDEVFWLGIWNDPDLWSVNTRVKNFVLSGWTPFWNAQDWAVVR